MISEIEIQKFINEQRNINMKTLKTSLDKHYSTIDRLYNHEKISRSRIYRFLKSQDKNIGNLPNFYKYIKRRFPDVEPTTETPNKPTETALKPTETKSEDNESEKLNRTATSKLSDDYDLLDDVEMGSYNKWITKLGNSLY